MSVAIVTAVARHQVIIIRGHTGCGKTTQVSGCVLSVMSASDVITIVNYKYLINLWRLLVIRYLNTKLKNPLYIAEETLHIEIHNSSGKIKKVGSYTLEIGISILFIHSILSVVLELLN